MCTIVVLRRPGHRWPLIVGANRDEMVDRPWAPPGRHWPDRPGVVAGLDRLAGGTWLGLNDAGVLAAVANRRGSLGPAAGKESRGSLPLRALDHARAAAAARELARIDGGRFRAFNLVVADPEDAFWLANRDGAVTVAPIPEGLSMLTAGDLDDAASPRIARFRPRFAAAHAPDPDRGDWAAWEALLAATDDAAPASAMTLYPRNGFATVSSALIALAARGSGVAPIWRFAPGPPDLTAFAPVAIAPARGRHLRDC